MPSIGKDLARIRHFKKLTLQDLHTKTRISLEILETLEAGRLLSEPVENEVYARSYTRTVARAMGIADEVITEALDQQKSGTYEGMLLDLFPGIVQKTSVQHLSGETEGSAKPASSKETPKRERARGTSDSSGEKATPTSADDTPSDGSNEETTKPASDTNAAGDPDASSEAETSSDVKSTAKTTDSPKSSTDPTDEANERDTEKGSGAERQTSTSKQTSESGATTAKPAQREKKRADQIDWAAMGQRFSTPSKRSSGWILGLGLVLIFVAATLWIAFQTDLLESMMEGGDGSPEQVETPATDESESNEGEGLGLDLGESVDDPSGVRPPEAAGAQGAVPTRLDTTLYLTIYGAFGPLDPVRIWSDLKPRFDPYWIEEGQAMQFEFRDTIRVRSQYEESLLFLNGHRIDNARDQYYNQAEQSVELTRSLFTPESEWASPRELELPDTVAVPDTIRMRPIFN